MEEIKGSVARPTRLQQWHTRLNDQATSGQSISAWCRDHGYSRQLFYYWRKKLGAPSMAQVQEGSPGEPSSVQFVKIVLRGPESC